NAFNPDGIPVAIEGLRRLSLYLRAIVPGRDRQIRNFAANLGVLAGHNETFEHSRREQADFDRWSPVAHDLLTKLERTTKALLPRDSDQ
ncbi:MAG: hypothetical protein ABSB15_30100, partial [Bryobacteraceae bacterium]